jgi:hypothetical protein
LAAGHQQSRKRLCGLAWPSNHYLRYDVPTYVNTLALGKDGAIHAVAHPDPGSTRSDLMRTPPVKLQ